MERIPKIRIIGNAPGKEKEKARDLFYRNLYYFYDSLTDQEKKDLEEYEIQKTEEETEIIKAINEETSLLMKEIGIESYNIPNSNYHILSSEKYEKHCEEGAGKAYIRTQTIVLNEKEVRKNSLLFATIALHETLHIKACLSMRVEEYEDNLDSNKKETKITEYRDGVAIISSRKDDVDRKFHTHFKGLNEGIVAELEKRLFSRLLENKIFKKQKEWLSSEKVKEIKKEVDKEKDILETDITWVHEEEREEDERVERVYYSSQRKVLNYICSEIQKEFNNKFERVDDVFSLFVKAHFTGRILEIARVIEETFGKGSFRSLGNMGIYLEDGNLFFETFKKLRINKLKEKNK